MDIKQDDQKRYDFLKNKLFKKDGTPKANASEIEMSEFYTLEDTLTKPDSLKAMEDEEAELTTMVAPQDGMKGGIESVEDVEVTFDDIRDVISQLTARVRSLEDKLAQQNVTIGGLQAEVRLRIPEADLSNLPTIPDGADVKIGKKLVVDNVCGRSYEHYVDAG